MNKKNIRIGIDARFYGPGGKGLGRYTKQIVDNILKIDEGHEYAIFLHADNFDEFVVPDELIGRVQKIKVRARWYGIREQLIMPFKIWRTGINLMHFPHFNVPLVCPSPFIVTIHDLILTKFPTTRASTLKPFFYHFKNLAYRLVIKSALRRAKKIIAVSQFTKQDIISQFKVIDSKIEVIYEGVANLQTDQDSLFVKKQDQEITLHKYGLPNNFLLYVGNAYPHKNLDFLLKVFKFSHKKHEDWHLVLVGKSDYFYERLKNEARHLGLFIDNDLNSPVIFPGYVPDQDLEALYARARLYIFPSLYEGFGLPPLEAMSQNCPVLSSDRASLPEVLGEAALYFDPESAADLLNKIEVLMTNDLARDKLIRLGQEQFRRYNWWEAASSTYNVYKKIIYGL